MKIITRALLLLSMLAWAGVAHAQGKVNVVTATEDLASIAAEVGGDKIAVDSIAKGYQDPHFVEAKPSFILKLQRADLLIVVGRELEIGWLPPLINQSRNAKVQPGGPGYLDASLQARILDLPTGQITRAKGDVHPLGNPHYWLDPENGKIIAKSIAAKLGELRPNDRAFFDQRLADFTSRLDAAEKRWLAQMAPYKGAKVVTYHSSYPNFAERFGLNVVGFVEPRPGIPPTPQHTLDLILTELGQSGLPTQKNLALNERDYGDLSGLNKDDARKKWGEEQVHVWRRSYDVPPPGGESLKDTLARALPYYVQEILPGVLRGERTLVAAHGNSLRALIMVLEKLSPEGILKRELATGEPVIYRIGKSGKLKEKVSI